MIAAVPITNELSGLEFPMEVGGNLSINLDPFAELRTIDSLDEDLVRVAAFIYAADLAIKREEREQHLRSVSIRVPVVNIQAFERVHSLVEQALMTVSVDNWTLAFELQTDGAPAANRKWPKKENATLMFSGGLDSFAGAIDLLQHEQAITLTSHVTHSSLLRTRKPRPSRKRSRHYKTR